MPIGGGKPGADASLMMKRTATRSRATGSRIAATLLIVLLTAGVLAGVVVQWSAASPAGVFTNGSAAVAGGRASALDAKGLAPGQTISGGFVISNDGGTAGRLLPREGHGEAVCPD